MKIILTLIISTIVSLIVVICGLCYISLLSDYHDSQTALCISSEVNDNIIQSNNELLESLKKTDAIIKERKE